MYYLYADLSDAGVNTRLHASGPAGAERHLLYMSAGPGSGLVWSAPGLSRHFCLALDQRLFTSTAGRLS